MKLKFIESRRLFSHYIVHPTSLLTKILPLFIWNIQTQEKVLYLTFDDGPIPELSEKILDLLNQYKAEATFFCVGENVEKYPNLYEKILNAGHSVGNHTYSHLNGWKNNTEFYIENVEKSSQLIDSTLFRPPYGKIKPSQHNVLRKNYSIVLWDILSRDYDKTISPEQCFENIRKFAKPGSIIVFHDNLKAEKNMLYALQRTLSEFSEKEFSFRKLTPEIIQKSQLLNVDKSFRQTSG
jgi:peptidoglycan/xylan/chitin deacetylase (PgdA/CDA1 family)